ncbi:MAG: hypothetical protein IPK63_18745 [Candidatus Competibacteraceae bacterium]|nr:hypothetical protein [Candidatus Competibacteraceae bacterium]
MTTTASLFDGKLFEGGLFNGGIFERSGAAINPNFVFTIDTTKAGVTGSSAFRIPMVSGSVYDFNVDWGDASNENVSGSALTAKDHTYSSPGIYIITISGTFPRIFFNDAGDKLKVLSTQNLGAVGWTSFAFAFLGCSNQTTVEGDVDWGVVTDCQSAWSGNNLTSWAVELPTGLTNCQSAWYGNNLTSWTIELPPGLTNCSYAWRDNNLTSWTVELPTGLTNCIYAWRDNNLTSWTVELPTGLTNCIYAWRDNNLTSWTVELPTGLTNCSYAWYGNNLTSWTVELPTGLTNCSYAWSGNNLTSWAVELPTGLTNCSAAWYTNAITSWTGGGWAGVTNANNAIGGGTNNINTTDYNALLVAIEANNQNNNVPFHFGLSKHSGAGTTARAALIADHSDTITDGGPA